MTGEFKNEALTSFADPANVMKYEEAIKGIQKDLGKEYPLIIGGEKIKAKDTFKSINPSNKDEVIGVFQKANEELAEKALDSAVKTFETWKKVPYEKRADILFKTAEIMRKKKFELSAQMTYEVGKNWVEADADVAEAIDFCEFYASEMLRYGAKQPVVQIPSEIDELFYIPLGATLVIPPWNFPFAILTGMTVASWVTGNTVVLKPSSDAPGIAWKFMEIMQEAGLPPGVVNFLTGPGSIAGEYLVKHPKTRLIAFTGSKEVGLRIVENAGKTMPGQIWIKRVIAEMGGKDAIVVDNEANIDDAVEGVAVSAFGFQGQKCSACSRAIVVEDIYDVFVEKLAQRVKKISVGPVIDRNNYMGPVVNASAYKTILNYIEIGKKEGRLITGGGPAEGNGFFIQPTVIADLSPKATIAQEEIFGPVLAVIKAKNFDDALRIANDTEFGLTGAAYSLNKDKIKKAKEEFHVGNLYLNRKCTGALVGVHPFGGFNMSGTDSKAGGRDYLLLFMQAKSVSEKKL